MRAKRFVADKNSLRLPFKLHIKIFRYRFPKRPDLRHRPIIQFTIASALKAIMFGYPALIPGQVAISEGRSWRMPQSFCGGRGTHG